MSRQRRQSTAARRGAARVSEMAKSSHSQEDRQTPRERLGEKGWKAIQAGDFQSGAASYARAVEKARRAGDITAEAVYSSYLGLCRLNLGQAEEAAIDLERSIALAADAGLVHVEYQARILLGGKERAGGASEKATGHFMRALEIALDVGDSVGIEMAFGNLGLIYLERGWAEQASECFRQALEAGAESPNRAAWLGSLGQALSELGEFQESVRYYREAYAEAVLADNAATQANASGSEGNVHFEEGRYDEAVACYRQAIAITGETGDAGLKAIWLGNLGNTLRKLGDTDGALAAIGEALEISRSEGDRHAESAHIDSLGDCFMDRGEAERALEHYGQALAISQSIADRQGERIYLSNMGRAHEKLGQLKPAFEFLSRAIDLFDDQRARIKSDDLKTSFAARGQDLYSDMVQVCLSLGKRVEALEYVGRAKSRAILDLLANSPIDVGELEEGGDDGLKKLIAREAELRSQITRFEKLFWQGGQAGEAGHRGATPAAEDARAVYSEWRQAVNQLKRRHPAYASLIAVDTLKYQDIQSLWCGAGPQPATLGDDVAILEFFWTDSYLLAASVWKDAAEPAVFHVGQGEKLDEIAADLADFLEMSATEGWEVPVSLCGRLYDQLVAPLLSGLPEGVRRLIVVPHGCLYRLPFAALHDGSRYLIERFSLSYLPTVSLIPVLSRKPALEPARKSRYLVSAISDYSATRKEGLVFSSRLRSAAGLDDLGYTIDEARTIYDLGVSCSPDSRLVTNDEVSTALPELFSQYPVIHFAGHAVFNPDEPLASGLVLSDGSILSAAAILQGNTLRTDCGRLLVLSACQTGVSAVTAGGEILGLARALMYAGMPNLILSLWEVADRSTSDLMKDFHRSWQGGDFAIADALRSAQVSALSSGQPVHAWAPFIQMGIE